MKMKLFQITLCWWVVLCSHSVWGGSGNSPADKTPSSVMKEVQRLSEKTLWPGFEALDYPVAILKRNKIEAYLIKKDFYEKMVDYFEDIIDARALQEYDPSEGIMLEDVLKELGL